MYKFVDNIILKVTNWIEEWFDINGRGCNAIIGISGGVDSSVVAALCVKALGKERVIGVLMPDGSQDDIEDARSLVKHLDIKSYEVNIANAVEGVLDDLPPGLKVTDQTLINLPARIRMATLYAISQSSNGRVANTCNLSEDYIGYSTRYGDSVGDFSPLANITKTEVFEIAKALNLPRHLADKAPTDGLCGYTDEQKIGFTYEVLDDFIRTGKCPDKETRDKIINMHLKNRFKLEPMPTFPYNASVFNRQ